MARILVHGFFLPNVADRLGRVSHLCGCHRDARNGGLNTLASVKWLPYGQMTGFPGFIGMVVKP